MQPAMTKMSNRPKTDYKLTAIGGNRYPTLEAAQEAVRETIVQELVAAIRKGLASGVLVVIDGKVAFSDDEAEL